MDITALGESDTTAGATVGFCIIDEHRCVAGASSGFEAAWSAAIGATIVARPGRTLTGDKTTSALLERLLLSESATTADDGVRRLDHRGTNGQVTCVFTSKIGEQRLIGLAQAPRQTTPPDEEARMATLASRLQAVLASAVDLDASITDAERIYRTVFENLSAAVPFDTGTIQILEDGDLRVIAAHGFEDPGEVVRLRFPLDQRFPNYWVVTGKHPLALEDIRVDFPHFLTSESQFGSGHIRSWMGVPLMDRGTVTGMLTLDRAEVDPFDADEIEIAQALANHAAVALTNARLYDRLQRSYDLQRMLLRELHHRVKNNLQMVSSLLNLRSLDVDPALQGVVQDLRTHIQALAATHDNLFQPGLSQDVQMQTYLEDIVRSVETGYLGDRRAIRVVRELAADLRCSMDVAIPAGLIVSELVLNAVKHAFPAASGGTITVTAARQEDAVIITVTDDGSGFPEPAEEGFGMTLVATLAAQIRAVTRRTANPQTDGAGAATVAATGTRWELTIPGAAVE